MTYSKLGFALACCAAIALQTARAGAETCRSYQRFPYAPPHLASRWKEFAADLSPTQQEVIATVVAGIAQARGVLGDGIDDRTLYFALPGNVLTLWFGLADNPTGEFAASLHRCGSGVTTTCRYAYPVVGSPDILFFPSRDGGPIGSVPEGLRWYQEVTEEFRPIDRIAKDAYDKYGVASPWSLSIDYFEPC